MITPDDAWVSYAHCEVLYDGRASSNLSIGNYLLVYKPDRSLSIHGGDKIGPRNYLGSGSRLTFVDNVITATKKKETVRIIIHQIHWLEPVHHWSISNIRITRTEQELVQKIVADPSEYLGFTPDSIVTEYRTSVGPIDIMAIKGSVTYPIEVKRKLISINNCVQLRKYLDVIEGEKIGYVAGPGITDRAKAYCEKHGLRYFYVIW